MSARSIALASASLMLLLPGCSFGDIDAKNSVGEKITIKKSTISNKKWGPENAQKLLLAKEATNFRTWAQLNYRNCASGLPASECKERWLGRDYQKQLAESEDLKDFISKGLEINYVEFTPIFTDLNNQKTPMGKISYACPPREGSAEDSSLTNRIVRLANFTVELAMPGFDLQPIQRRICSTSS